ncbi:hypothetical protein EVAR_54659_1 [Eumeta japonica]|uniref:Uncharacterized protein n=1 Tax=Eumeta variegata TaxID=151549 RepID=A0A4C1XA31_EUMVA|nr:hypothetical protein EVAR_54659_1 [Eumeta japonica]
MIACVAQNKSTRALRSATGGPKHVTADACVARDARRRTGARAGPDARPRGRPAAAGPSGAARLHRCNLPTTDSA